MKVDSIHKRVIDKAVSEIEVILAEADSPYCQRLILGQSLALFIGSLAPEDRDRELKELLDEAERFFNADEAAYEHGDHK